MKRIYPLTRIAFISILLLTLILPVYAQFSGNIDIAFTPEQDTLTIGEVVSLRLTVTTPANYQVNIPALPRQWGAFEIRRQVPAKTVLNDNETQTTIQQLEMTLFSPGTYQTPPWSVSLQKTGEANTESIERAVPQVSLTVLSVLQEGDTTLRQLKPQAELPVPPLWPWVLGGLAAILLLTWIGWRLYQKYKTRFARSPAAPTPATVTDPRPAHQIALEELTRIEQLDLPGQGRLKEYYTLVSECQRRYLHNRYHIPAPDLTTTQIKTMLTRTDLGQTGTRQFISLFTDCDLVKFARLVPPAAQAHTLLDQARTLIHLSMPNGNDSNDGNESLQPQSLNN